MKKALNLILIPLSLITGFGLAVMAMYLVVILLGYVLIELAFRTIENPTVWMFLADAVCLALIVFVGSRKAIRSSFSGFWKQILRNM